MVWKPCVTPIKFTGRSIPLTTTAIGNSRVPATSSTPGSARMALMSSMVISWLSGWDLPGAWTISAQTRFDPTASICEMTNFLLVSATVTTSTIDALPIITPNDVSIARNLFARSASIDTDSVSFKSIMKFYSPCFYLLESPEAHMKEKTRAAWFRALTSILLDPLERLAGAFVFRIQLQRRLIFLYRRFLLSLVLIQAPQPL